MSEVSSTPILESSPHLGSLNSRNSDQFEDDEEEEEEDLHVCGSCKAAFKALKDFVDHKKSCVKKKRKKLEKESVVYCSNKSSDFQSLSSSPPEKEEEVISLLAKNLIKTKIPPEAQRDRNSTKTLLHQNQRSTLYSCSIENCPFSSKYAKDVTRHMRKHTGDKPFKCEECGKSFSRQDKLKNHSRLHTGEKPYACKQCPYRTSDSSSLKKHTRVHTDERPFRCQLCPYRAKESSQLTVHLRSHTGDSPFVCPHSGCSTAFKTSSDLKRHVRIHTGEKPYSCPYCSHKVTIKSNLTSHIRANHKKPDVYLCKSCDYKTKNMRNLQEHEKEHDVSLFKCSSCNFSTANETSINSHIIKKHSEKKSLSCSYCPFTCKWKGALSAHVNKKHGRLSSDTDDKKNSSTKPTCGSNFRCHLCDTGFVRKDSLSSHLRQHESFNKESEALPSTGPSLPTREQAGLVIDPSTNQVFTSEAVFQPALGTQQPFLTAGSYTHPIDPSGNVEYILSSVSQTFM